MSTNKYNLLIMMFFIALFACGTGCDKSDKEESGNTAGTQNPPTTQEIPSRIEQQNVLVAEPKVTTAETVGETPPPPQDKTVTPDPELKPTEIEWQHSVAEGLALAKRSGKPAMIDFYADWCAPCQQMEKATFRDKRVIEELARFVAIKGDLTRSSSSGRSAARKYGVQAIPTYVFIDTQGKQTIKVGYRPPDRFLQILQTIK